MNERLKVGVVGCGYWGPNLIRNFRSLPDCELTLVCDVDEARLAHQQRLHPGLATEREFSRLVNGSGLDAIIIATPVHLHHKLAKDSLLSGRHTFIEKPMAPTVAECQELVDIAAAKELTLMVGHTFLYSAPVRKVKEIVDSGDIGDIRYISSRRLNLGLFQKDINVVWDLAPHDVSIIQYIMGEKADAVNCNGAADITPGVEDVATMSLHFPNGSYATVHNSWLEPRKVREMTIVGTKRMIVYDDLEPLQKIRIYDTRVETPPHYDTFEEFHYSYHYGDMYVPHIKQEEALRVECQHFLDAIRHAQRPLTAGDDGLQLIKVLAAASESLQRHGARVAVENGSTANIALLSEEAAAPKTPINAPKRKRIQCRVPVATNK